MTFLAYDKARISAVNEFLAGKAIRDIAYQTSLFFAEKPW